MSRFICIVMAFAMLLAFSGCDEAPAAGGGATVPVYTNDLFSAGASATAAVSPDATDAGGTAGATPDVTPQPTESLAPTATGTPAATATPKPTATACNGGTLAVDPVIGKADVSEYLTLRKTASDSAKSLAQIPKDGEFTVLLVETGKKWLKVKYGDLTGFVPAKFVTVGSDDGDRVCTVFCNSVLNVREGAGTSHDVIGSVGYGTNLIVKSKTTVNGKTWYKVEIGSSFGYVIAQYCRIAED